MNIKETVSKSKYDALLTICYLRREYVKNFSVYSSKAAYFNFLSDYYDNIRNEFIDYLKTYRMFFIGPAKTKVKVIAIDENLNRVTYVKEKENKNASMSIGLAIDWYIWDKWKICHEC